MEEENKNLQEDWPSNKRFDITECGLFEIEYTINNDFTFIKRFDPFAKEELKINNENFYEFKFPTPEGKTNKEKLNILFNQLSVHPFLMFVYLLKETINEKLSK